MRPQWPKQTGTSSRFVLTKFSITMNNTKIKIDLSWNYAAQVILLSLNNGNAEGKKIAKEELFKMAALADKYADEHKEPTNTKKKLLLIEIETSVGEYEFTNYAVVSANIHSNKEKVGDKHVRNFYGDKPTKDGDGYSFFNGQISCRVIRVKEITRNQYKVLQEVHLA